MEKSEQRERLLEKHRYTNVNFDDWWDGVYEDFKRDMAAVGINVNHIYFSGFGSQGDGACFSGSFFNAERYLDHHHKGQYPMIHKLLEHGGGVYAECKHRGSYCHEYCTVFNVETSEQFYHLIECPTEFHEQIVDQWDRLLDDEIADFAKDVVEQWRTYMQDLYRRLADEHDYLTGDEAVWETIEANEWDQDEEDTDEAT